MPGDEENKKPELAGGEQPQDVSDAPLRVGVPIQIGAHDIAPESQMPGGEYFKETAAKTNYIIIQFTESPSVEQERQLRDLHVQYCSKIPPYTWKAKFEPQDLTQVRQLPYVVFANPFHESLSLDPGLEAKLHVAHGRQPQSFAAMAIGSSDSESSFVATSPPEVPEELHDVIIKLHPLSKKPEEMRTFLASRHYGIPRERVFLGLGSLSASLTAEQILRVAKIDDVEVVHEEPQRQSYNHLVGDVVNTLDAGAVAAFHLGKPDTWKLTGKDEIIVIADSGLGNGILDGVTGSLESTDPVQPFFNGRIKMLDPRSDDTGKDAKGANVTRVGKCVDLAGHGTHVAGIALGAYGGMTPQADIKLYGTRLDGVATGANLIMQITFGCPVYDVNGKLTSDGPIKLAKRDHAAESMYLDPYYMYPAAYSLNDINALVPTAHPVVAEPYTARIHSNSWGPTITKTSVGYSTATDTVDKIVYHAQDLLIIFAAGNDGDSANIQADWPNGGQIAGEPCAKNVLTVGACFNNRQFIKAKNPIFFGPSTLLYMSYESKADGGQAISPSHVCHMSSRGPTLSTRAHANIIKPDVVAPGIAVYSVKSGAKVSSEDHGVPPAPNPNGNHCTFMTGTSMAAPVVSGAAALLREALSKRGLKNPSAALIKALIVNGAVDLSSENGTLWQGNKTSLGGDGNTSAVRIGPAPNDVQGWGRLDIAASVENVVNTEQCGLIDIKLEPGVDENSIRDGRLKPDQTPKDSHPWTAAMEPPRDPKKRANIKATLAYSDQAGGGLVNVLALSLVFEDVNRRGIAVDTAGTGTDAALKRMAKNNVQRLEINNIDVGKASLKVFVTVTEVETALDTDRAGRNPLDLKARQAYAVCWKVWYT